MNSKWAVLGAGLVAALLVTLAALPAAAQSCHNVYVAPRAAVYHAPAAYYAPAAYAVKQVVYEKVYANPDFYYSLRDYVREERAMAIQEQNSQLQQQNTLLLQRLLQQGGADPGQPPAAAPQKQAAPAPKATGGTFEQRLQAAITAHCLDCHGGAKGTKGEVKFAGQTFPVDLRDVTKVPRPVVAKCASSVLTGKMPKDGQISVETAELFAEWPAH